MEAPGQLSGGEVLPEAAAEEFDVPAAAADLDRDGGLAGEVELSGLALGEASGDVQAAAEVLPGVGVGPVEAPVGEEVLGAVGIQEAEGADAGDASEVEALHAERALGAAVEDEPLVEGGEGGVVLGGATR